MSDFPIGGSKEETRNWLVKKGFTDLFVGWEADALLGADAAFIKSKFPKTPEGEERAEMLCGYLSTAKSMLKTSGNEISDIILMINEI